MRRWLVLGAGLVVAGLALVLVLTSGEAPDTGPDRPAPATGGAATLGISPVRSVVRAAQPTTTVDYRVGNDGDVPRTYTISTGELDTTGRPLADSAASAGRWARPVQARVEVPAHGTAAAHVRVAAPRDRGASTRRLGVTFSDSTATRGGTVGVRARITTSVYVEGTGPTVRRTRVSDVSVPHLGFRSVPVRARLHNEGTTTLVPGSLADGVVGTASQGGPFSLGGDVAGPRTTVQVSGRLQDLPVACWCQVRVSAADGSGGTTSATARVLVLPWPWLGGALAVLVVALAGARWRRVSAPRAG